MMKKIKKVFLKLSSILCFIGSIIMIIISMLELVGIVIHFFLPLKVFTYFRFIGSTRILITLICGLIALYGSKRVKSFSWTIVLIIVGLIGDGIGGILVFIGALLAAISVAI